MKGNQWDRGNGIQVWFNLGSQRMHLRALWPGKLERRAQKWKEQVTWQSLCITGLMSGVVEEGVPLRPLLPFPWTNNTAKAIPGHSASPTATCKGHFSPIGSTGKLEEK
jgi:hypothetical protein